MRSAEGLYASTTWEEFEEAFEKEEEFVAVRCITWFVHFLPNLQVAAVLSGCIALLAFFKVVGGTFAMCSSNVELLATIPTIPPHVTTQECPSKLFIC